MLLKLQARDAAGSNDRVQMANDYQVLHFFFYDKKKTTTLHHSGYCMRADCVTLPVHPCHAKNTLAVGIFPAYIFGYHACTSALKTLSLRLGSFKTLHIQPGSWQLAGCPHGPQQKLFKGPSGASMLLLSLLLLRTAALPSSGGPAQVTGMSWDLLRVPNI